MLEFMMVWFLTFLVVGIIVLAILPSTSVWLSLAMISFIMGANFFWILRLHERLEQLEKWRKEQKEAEELETADHQ